MPLNKETKPNQIIFEYIYLRILDGTQLPLWIKVDLGVMAMKRYFTLPKDPKLEPTVPAAPNWSPM